MSLTSPREGKLDEVFAFPAPGIGALVDAANIGDSNHRHIAAEAMRHRFDLLGSGPVEVTYDMKAAGAFGTLYSSPPGRDAETDHRRSMRTLLEKTVEFTSESSAALDTVLAALENYRPIDWHIDFKSGYRWSPEVWWADISIGHRPGADIKVPWELSRGHHLVALGLNAANGDVDSASEVALQFLDWITANPPRMGVNWRSTLELGIRAANWSWALSLARKNDSFPESISWLVAKSLYQHGQFIEQHLDYVATGTNNHYLGDIVGLLHIAAALPTIPEAPRWTAIGIHELESEMRRTVHPDGVNYEGSTGYHRLVTEMFLHGTLLACTLSQDTRAAAQRTGERRRKPEIKSGSWSFDPGSPEVFPKEYWERLRRMVGFTRSIMKPDGSVPQIGDQDNSRFLRFDWFGRTSPGRFAEDHQDHRHILGLGGELLGITPSEDSSLLESVLGNRISMAAPTPASDSQDLSPGAETYLSDVASTIWYPNGGIAILKSGPIYLSIICRQTSSGEPTGHRHGDQLSFELNVDGVDFLVDAGTGVYSADFSVRNQMRSTRSHNTLSVPGVDPFKFSPGVRGLFRNDGSTDAAPIQIEPGSFRAGQHWSGVKHERYFSVTPDQLLIEDTVDGPDTWSTHYLVAPGVEIDHRGDSGVLMLTKNSVTIEMCFATAGDMRFTDELYSDSYGAVSKLTGVAVAGDGNRCVIKFTRIA